MAMPTSSAAQACARAPSRSALLSPALPPQLPRQLPDQLPRQRAVQALWTGEPQSAAAPAAAPAAAAAALIGAAVALRARAQRAQRASSRASVRGGRAQRRQGAGVDTAPAEVIARDSQSSPYNWAQQWYPVYPLKMLEGNGPVPLTLLGKEMVLWRDGLGGGWNCSGGICPHRLAPLSQGRVDEKGRLTCRFHGWCFKADGACDRVPMAEGDLEAESRLLGTARTRLAIYPTKEKKGLLFVWPDDASVEAASVAEPFVGEDIAADADWFMFDAPAGWRVWLEQTWDPSHAPFLHEHALPFFKPEFAAPMRPFDVEDRGDEGIVGKHGGYMKSNLDLVVSRTYVAPCTNYSIYTYPDGRQIVFSFYFVPVKPGTVRQITTSAFKISSTGEKSGGAGQTAISNMLPQGRNFLQAPSRAAQNWVVRRACACFPGLEKVRRGFKNLQILSGRLGDQDNSVLSFQGSVSLPAARDAKGAGRLAASVRFGGGPSEYVLETHADEFVARFDAWIDARGGGPFGLAEDSGQNQSSPRSQAELMDRWTQHTSFCPDSRAALHFFGAAASTLERCVAPGALSLTALLFLLGAPRAAALPTLVAAGAAAASARLRRLAHGFVSGLPEAPMAPERRLWEP